jgi:glyoxylase-like metal-dependent hydrolase (beta-lactamase superfamily II)/ferredoxin
VALLLVLSYTTQAFVTPTQIRCQSSLKAAPKRLEENVDGVLYVNDKCINCSACSHFAPNVFKRSPTDQYHVVHRQPDSSELGNARAALAACPVAAIRVESQASQRHHDKPLLSEKDVQLAQSLALSPKMNGLQMPFPREIIPNHIYFVGHHNEASFGATPYLTRVRFRDNHVWILVDSPKFGKFSKEAIVSLTGPNGPDYMLLTHVDDVAGHGQWKDEFPSMQRIFHAGDLGRNNWIGDLTLEDVEVLLPNVETSDHGLTMYSLDGNVLTDETAKQQEVIILHTPGHSPGSISLYQPPNGQEQPGVLFTGDTYAYSTRTNSMNAFPRYGNNLKQQAKTLKELLEYDWDLILPGHGHKMDYTIIEGNKDQVKQKDVQQAIEHMKSTRKW